MFDIKENLKKLPDSPGVYLHKDSLGQVIYVGKAISLRNRVRQYFQSSKNQAPKVRAMVSHIAEFEYITTDSEVEALILECNLIKRYSPKYNILLRDDKTYPYIKVTLEEDYPRIVKTRRMITGKGSKYFGPYSDVGALNMIIDLLNDSFALKRCSTVAFPTGFKPCLNYHIEKCSGICMGKVSREEYGRRIKNIIDFLNGKDSTVIKELTQKLEEAAANMEFEKAAEYRDYIQAFDSIRETQRVVLSGEKDMDMLLVLQGTSEKCIVLFYVRDGKLSGREIFPLQSGEDESDGEIISSFIKQYYADIADGPREILVEKDFEERELLEKYLSGLWGRNTGISIPARGEKRALMQLAQKDVVQMATTIDEKARVKVEREEKLAEELFNILHEMGEAEAFEPNSKYRIEAYDISNINGVDSVGAMVVFRGTKPLKKDYRRFKIRTVEGPDDYSSLQEVLSRRIKRAMDGDPSFEVLPDIILMDGGKGHVSAAQEVLEHFNMPIPVVGMAKDDSHRTRALVYTRDGEFHEFPLKGHPLLFKYAGTVQEEVHRFAIEYHRGVRNKNMLVSVLDKIDGVGPVRRNALLAYFGSVDKIKKAGKEELCRVKEINEDVAENIIKYFN